MHTPDKERQHEPGGLYESNENEPEVLYDEDYPNEADEQPSQAEGERDTAQEDTE
jgi:hypothetical protein